MNIIQQNKKVYNTIAKHFSDTRSYVWQDLVPLIDYVKPGDRVLDLACGNGRLYQLIKKKSTGTGEEVNYLGVDYSEEQLKQAREKWPEAEFKYGAMTAIPCDDNEFDIVFCLAAFHHLPDEESRKLALAEMRRVLKKGGRLIMTNWNIYSDWARKKLEIVPQRAGSRCCGRNWKLGKDNKEIIVPWKNQDGEVLGERYYYAYTPEELEKMLNDAGFTVDKQYFAAKKGANNANEGMNIVTIAIVR